MITEDKIMVLKHIENLTDEILKQDIFRISTDIR